MLHCDKDFRLDLTAIAGPVLLTLLSYCGTGPWLACGLWDSAPPPPSTPGPQGQSALAAPCLASGAWRRDSRGNGSDAAARHVEEGAGTGTRVQG